MIRKSAKLFVTLSLVLQLWTPGAAIADVDWQPDLGSAMNIARSSNKLIFVKVSATWCPPCRKLEKLTHDKRVGEFLNPKFVSVKLDADTPQGAGILKKYGMRGIPALLVFGPQGDLKGKQSGAPSDIDSFEHMVTNLADGEAALSAIGTMGGALQNFQQAGMYGTGQQAFQQPQQGQQMMQQFPGQQQMNYGQPQFSQGMQQNFGQQQFQQQPQFQQSPQFQQFQQAPQFQQQSGNAQASWQGLYNQLQPNGQQPSSGVPYQGSQGNMQQGFSQQGFPQQGYNQQTPQGQYQQQYQQQVPQQNQ